MGIQRHADPDDWQPSAAQARPIHLRPAQAQASCVQHASAHLRAIQAFYNYAEIRELDIDEAILAGRFEAILGTANASYCSFL